MALSAPLKKIMKKHPSLSVDGDKEKIRCSLSGHEMPPNLQSLESYVSGKKYKKLKEKQDFESELRKYKEHIVPSNKRHSRRQMFCKLTLRHLNQEPHHIRKHVQGKRFQKALARWEECKRTGETFKPRAGALKKVVPGQEEESHSSDADNDHDHDDLSDLYPEADFAVDAEPATVDAAATSDGQSESDDEFQDLSDAGEEEEEDEEKPAPSSSSHTPKPEKRKLKGTTNGPSSTNSKKQKTAHKKKNNNKRKK